MLMTLLAPATDAMADTKKQTVTITVKDASSGKVIPNAEVIIYVYARYQDITGDYDGTPTPESPFDTTGHIESSPDWVLCLHSTVKTNSKGVVTASLEPGYYKLVAKATKPRTGAAYGYQNTSKKLTVQSGKNASVTIKPKPYYGTYKITVKNAQTGKAANVKMCLKDTNGKVVKTFSSGTSGYSSYIKPGKYRVVVNDGNYNKRTLATITVEAGKSCTKTVTAIPVYKLNLKVLDKSGRLMKNKNITVAITANDMPDKSAKPNASGITAFTKVPRGNVIVTAYRTVNGKKETLYSGTMSISGTLGGTITKTIKLNKDIK